MSGIGKMRAETNVLIQQIRDDDLREWLESQKHPYIKHAMIVLKFERRIAEEPNAGDSYLSIAQVLHRAGNYPLALSCFE